MKNKKFMWLGALAALAVMVSGSAYFWSVREKPISSPLAGKSSSVQRWNKARALNRAECDKFEKIFDLYGHPSVSEQNFNASLNYSDYIDICNTDYLVRYSYKTKTPLWTVEIVNRGETLLETRSDNFTPDPRVDTRVQARNADYLNSGFDRGHIAAAGNMGGHEGEAMQESFYFTNIVPQVGPNMNRGIWRQLETYARKQAEVSSQAIVYTGVIFEENSPLLKGIKVPHSLYKIIYSPQHHSSQSFLMPNVQILTRRSKLAEGNPEYPQTTSAQSIECESGCTIASFQTKREKIESLAGIKLLNNTSQTLVEATPSARSRRKP